MWRTVWLSLEIATILLPPPPAGAQGQPCRPPSGSHEARLLAFYSAPIVFSPAGPPSAVPSGAVLVSGDATYIPDIDPALTAPQFCYAGKRENTRLSAVFPRPRVVIALPYSLALEGSYLPPIPIGGATANLGSIGLAHVRTIAEGIVVGLRLHATFGWVEGSITCPREHLQSDPTLPCYGTQPSKDTFRPNSVGGDVSVSHRALRGGRVDVYGGAGLAAMRPRFRVGFTDGLGGVDTTRVEADMTRASVFTGFAWHLVPTVQVSAQLYSVPSVLTTVRVAVVYALR
ncbi:MAG: hypothetical protein NVS4B3_17320 [Gemmatimonadaceae bacterium]